MKAAVVWTPTLIAELTRLHALVPEVSFSDIARRLQAQGHAVTRNGCIGKARRLGLPQRDPAIVIAVNTQRLVEYQRAKAMMEPRMPSIRLVKGKALPIAPVATNQRTGLHIDLEHDQCRGPLADGPNQHSIYLSCTADVYPGKVYCTKHCKEAYHPVGRR